MQSCMSDGDSFMTSFALLCMGLGMDARFTQALSSEVAGWIGAFSRPKVRAAERLKERGGQHTLTWYKAITTTYITRGDAW